MIELREISAWTLPVACLCLVAAAGMSLAQDVAPEAPAYCSQLKRVAALAGTKEKFASITGKPRNGNFRDTTLELTGWRDCSLYGPGTYTCDSQALATAEEAETAQARTMHDIKACLGEAWSEAGDRSSPRYVVLHHEGRPLSITLSTDQTDKNEHVVRLILFVRRN
jgi:hypothetical protein